MLWWCFCLCVCVCESLCMSIHEYRPCLIDKPLTMISDSSCGFLLHQLNYGVISTCLRYNANTLSRKNWLKQIVWVHSESLVWNENCRQTLFRLNFNILSVPFIICTALSIRMMFVQLPVEANDSVWNTDFACFKTLLESVVLSQICLFILSGISWVRARSLENKPWLIHWKLPYL